MLSLLWTLLIGFFVGLIARALYPGDDKLSLLWTVALGVAGSFLAKYVGFGLGWYEHDEAAGLIASTIGAMILLFVYSLMRRSRVKHLPAPTQDRHEDRDRPITR